MGDNNTALSGSWKLAPQGLTAASMYLFCNIFSFAIKGYPTAGRPLGGGYRPLFSAPVFSAAWYDRRYSAVSLYTPKSHPLQNAPQAKLREPIFLLYTLH